MGVYLLMEKRRCKMSMRVFAVMSAHVRSKNNETEQLVRSLFGKPNVERKKNTKFA